MPKQNIPNHQSIAPAPDEIEYVDVDETPETVITASNLPRLDYAFPEAPASVNFYGITPNGWNVQFTLRDIDERNLIKRFAEFTKYLIDNNVTPKQVGAQQPPVKPDEQSNVSEKHVISQLCPIHNVMMPIRTSKKTGKTFYSHQHEDGWCYGK